MSLTNTEIANNMIALLEKAKKHENLDDYPNPKQLFSKIAKMAIGGKDDKSKLVIKLNKEPTPYQLFVKEKMPEIMITYPDIPNNERMKKISIMWKSFKTTQTKQSKKTKQPKNNSEQVEETN